MPTAPAHGARWTPPPIHKGAGEADAEVGVHPLGLHGQVPHGREMPLPPVGHGRVTWARGGGEVGGAQVLAGL